MVRHRAFRIAFVLLASVLALTPAPAWAGGDSFIGPFHTISTIASTVPSNGDVNPYGTAVVPRTIGHLVQGDVIARREIDRGVPGARP